MSNLHLTYPFWAVLLLVLQKAWPVTLLVAVGLCWLGVARRGWIRWISLALSAALGSTLLFFAVLLLYQQAKTRTARDEMQREASVMSEVLARPWTGDGLTLPAGTTISWSAAKNQPDKMHFSSAELPGETLLFGLPFSGMFESHEAGWTGTLARDAVISGWWCRADLQIELRHDGELNRCVTARDGIFHGLLVPAGSALQLGGSEVGGVEVRVAHDRTMTLHDGSDVVVPGDADLELRANGSVVEITHVPMLLVRGVPLTFQVRWIYAEDPARSVRPIKIDGDLAAQWICGGTTFPKDDLVTLHLVTGILTANEMADGSAFPGKVITRCRLP